MKLVKKLPILLIFLFCVGAIAGQMGDQVAVTGTSSSICDKDDWFGQQRLCDPVVSYSVTLAVPGKEPQVIESDRLIVESLPTTESEEGVFQHEQSERIISRLRRLGLTEDEISQLVIHFDW